jgi:hypothetical protein
MPESPSAESTALQYDAFLSYSRADGAAVRRIQRFLESYRPPGRNTRLKVYLDETDMRGGSLPENLTAALSQSRALVVCWSDNAARSQWVNAEIAEFRKLGRPKDIAVVHVAGDGPTVRHEAFAGLAPIEHDLRHGWLGWFLKPKARIELLRLIAFLTNVEMRVLHNWARRRRLRTASIGVAAALLPVVGVLSVTQTHWEPLILSYQENRIEAVSCEVVDDKLWAAAWYREVGECSGACAYFVTFADAAKHSSDGNRSRLFPLARRALPEPQVSPQVMNSFRRRVNESGPVEGLDPNIRTDTARIAQPRPGHFVSVLPILLTEEEHAQAIAASAVDRMAPPESNGSFIVIYKVGAKPKLKRVTSLSPPAWKKFTADKQETSPARAISVIWQSNDEIWIGVAGERGVPGGLWHSSDGGGDWKIVDGFTSVTSLDLAASPNGGETLLVAEERFERVQGEGSAPGKVRMVERAAGNSWPDSSAPPFGSNSEIEICGTLPDGSFHVRVDGTIYQKSSRPLLRTVLD